ncbi:MAG TPA: spondin domain-containing protein [Gammaproteobacteria bacterium]|nr:spondin domain-containing protein [Gammaproteobacteria bacterium]
MFAEIGKSARAMVAAALAAFSIPAAAGGPSTYQVTVTNLTHSINFTPILVASLRRPVSILELGSPASDELAAVAEGGDLGPLTALLEAKPRVVDVENSGGLLGPGESVTVIVDAARGARYISLASMMLPTNDGFIALDGVRVGGHHTATYYSPGYDAGSEANDEWCANIPGPTCDGVGPSPGVNFGDEGYVHIHRGIHGVGDLAAATYDWRNPVAKITIVRVKGD